MRTIVLVSAIVALTAALAMAIATVPAQRLHPCGYCTDPACDEPCSGCCDGKCLCKENPSVSR